MAVLNASDREALLHALADAVVAVRDGQPLADAADDVAAHLEREAEIRDRDERRTRNASWVGPDVSESGMAEVYVDGAQVSVGYRRGVLRVIVDTSGCPGDDPALDVDVEDVTVYSRLGKVGDVRDSVMDEAGNWRTCELHGGAITQDCQCTPLIGLGDLAASAAYLYETWALEPWKNLTPSTQRVWLEKAAKVVQAYHQV